MKTIIVLSIFVATPAIPALLMWALGGSKSVPEVFWIMGTVLSCATLGCFITAKIAEIILR